MSESERSSTPVAPERARVSRSLIVVVRLVLLLLAGSAGVFAVSVVWREPSGASAAYSCPMHPEVRSAKPAQCPICGMALTADTHGAAAMSPHDSMMDLTAVENVRKHKVLDFVRKRSMLFDQRELRGAAWVEPDQTITAIFYADQAESLTAEDDGAFSPTRAPEQSVAVRRTSEPAAPWDPSTVRVHFELVSVQGKKPAALSPGLVGWVEMRRKARSVLTVPADAILQSPSGPYVLRSLGNFKFEKRPIQIGETFSKQGVAVVLSGLAAQDLVVSRAAFFLDADRRLDLHAGEEDWGTP